MSIKINSTDSTNELVETKTDMNDDKSTLKPRLDLYVSNIQVAFSVGCKLDLRRIALEAYNVELTHHTHVRMSLRSPPTVYKIYHSGKITGLGAWNEPDALKGARRVARILQKLNFKVRFTNFRVTNIMASCRFPYQINISR